MPIDSLILSFNEQFAPTTVRIERTETEVLVFLGGSLDTKSAGPLTALLGALLDEMPISGLLALDTSMIKYISSAGIGALATTMMKAKKRSARLVLRKTPAGVEKIIDTLGLTYLFHQE